MITFYRFRGLFKNTLDKEYRTKMLFLFLVIGLGLTALLHYLIAFVKTSEMTAMLQEMLGQAQDGILLSFVQFLGHIWSMILGVSIVRSDIEEDTLPSILALPISRSHYLLGRISGGIFLVFCFFALTFGGGVATLSYHHGSLVFPPGMLLGIPTMMCSFLGILTLGIFVSLFVSRLMGFVVLMILLAIINGASAFATLPTSWDQVNIFNIVGPLIYNLLPLVGDMAQMGAKGLKEGFSLALLGELAHFFGTYLLLFGAITGVLKKRSIT